MNTGKLFLFLFLFSAFVFMIGCDDDETNTIGPQFEPEISNIVDYFQFQATGLTNVSQTLTYTWNNTGVSANINQSCSMTGGSAALTIKDADGTVVFSSDLTENGTLVTSDGTAGNWTITVVLTNVDGTLNFRAEKRTP
ncbi:MAG: hypothetical protein AB7W47_00035 [Calditrichaceae bacterium]